MSGQVAVFRCDASRQLGSGHVVRCLALADALAEAGWTCIFATTPGTRNAVPLLANSSHRLLELTGANDELVQLVQELPEGCHLLIVDHYQRDVQFEAGARPWADRILAIDDLADYSKSTVEEVLLFNIQPDKYLMKIADALLTAATEINIALENLREHPASASGHVLKAKKTENFIEHRYREGLAELFTHDDFQYIFRHREIYRHLSNAADKVDLAADILSDIIIKSI